MILMQPLNQPKDRLRCLPIQIPRRLIRQQNLRLRHQRPRQAHPLLLPAAQLARPMLLPRSASPTSLQPDPRPLHRRRPAYPPSQQRHRHILHRRKLRQQIVKLPHIPHIADSETPPPACAVNALNRLLPTPHLARRRLIQRRQQMQQGTLARAALPHNRHHLARHKPPDPAPETAPARPVRAPPTPRPLPATAA